MLQRHVEPVVCKAFLGQAYVVALLTEGQLLGLTTPTRLLAAIERPFELFHSAGWASAMIPKFHWQLRYP